MGYCKQYSVKFLTCDGATCTQYGMSTLYREFAGEGLKSCKITKNGRNTKGSKSQKNQYVEHFTGNFIKLAPIYSPEICIFKKNLCH